MDEGTGQLGVVVRHAQRLAALLFVHELTPPQYNEAAAIWLLGRAAEVERYVESVADDRSAGRLDDETALATLETYVVAIHAGLASVVGVTDPACCRRTRRGRRRGSPL